ncbi:hypothetical protein J1614_000898 [Plenodomus biglobosus]|nr:hypothetical protein J1614_000898 [Plenodomus biglobosus]
MSTEESSQEGRIRCTEIGKPIVMTQLPKNEDEASDNAWRIGHFAIGDASVRVRVVRKVNRAATERHDEVVLP